MSNNPFRRKNKAMHYDMMCRRFEDTRMYDGRGTYDLYECDSCEHKILTTYIDKGVTPFKIRCKRCNSSMTHTQTFKSLEDAPSLPCYGWYRPGYTEFLKLSDGSREHIKKGGLLLAHQPKLNIKTEMIKEEYVQYEAARLLKEAGFPQDRDLYDPIYTEKSELIEYKYPSPDDCSCVTQAQAMRWLREERSLHIEVEAYKRYGKPMYGWTVISTRDDFLIGASDVLPAYEAAVERAIKAACEFLTEKGGER